MKKVYAINWPEIADRVKNIHNNTCEACHHKHDPKNGYTMTVHHIDRNTMNNEPWNLACLCQRCHLRYEKSIDLAQMLFFFFYTDGWLRPHLLGYLESKKQKEIPHEPKTNPDNNGAASAP